MQIGCRRINWPILTLFAASLLAQSHAATIAWTNAAGGSWSTAANWDPNLVPGAADTAVIAVGGLGGQPVSVTLDISTTIGGLILGSTGSCGGGQRLQLGGRTLILDGPAVVTSCGELTVDSGTLAGTTNASMSGTIGWTAG